ncbi:MAG: 50S ribosomal protein L29 [Bdellovibrionaceae bacterium]|nr:50S ribosomal protein L29 [Bdellovibrionales bacterium]MCB9084663.1 50S ribosomal protein L29 [Pseudobdellovibrionaceae bacterium]
MKFADIRDLTVEELRKRLGQMREELFELNMKHSLGQVASPVSIRDLRRDIARVQTALSMKLAQ